MKRCLLLVILSGICFLASGQRKYVNSSVLSAGNWLKIAVDAAGVYKLSAEDLKKSGFSQNISSNQIRLYGNGGRVLPEANSDPISDDLQENAIEMQDGGDGKFDGSDFFLFYAPGPHQWVRDSSEMGFYYRKNPYTDQSFYFLQIGTAGEKRIVEKSSFPSTGTLLDMFDEHLHHELDSINFLKSGKEWYGEHFSNQTGAVASRDFNLNIPNGVGGSYFYLKSSVIGNSVEESNTIAVSVNGKKVLEHLTKPGQVSLISPIAHESVERAKEILSGVGITVNYQHKGGSINAASWLNWFDFVFKRTLDLSGLTQLSFRLKNISTPTAINFAVSNADSRYHIWDVSDAGIPQKIKTVPSSNGFGFLDSVTSNNEYIVFDPLKAKTATILGKISNQNLHQLPSSELIIITNRLFTEQASRLREHHLRLDKISTLVVDIDQIYNEFSSGSPDPTAIRNFLKMVYDRSHTGNTIKPAYLLLFGSASYIVKGKMAENTIQIPSYQTDESLDPLLSYVTDDYFGILDDAESIREKKNIPLLDLGIGRLPVRTVEQAKRMVDKIIRYTSSSSLGMWRNHMTLVADDEDYNLHLEDAELHAALIQKVAPQFRVQKIYLDAYQQQSNAGGSRYPEVNKEVFNDINNGSLIWNYSGHGNSTRLAYEVVLDKELLAQWKNENRLSFFVTATCDFAPFDDPSQFSLGEDLLIGRSTGAIGLVTTTRLVFASSNREMNNAFLSSLTTRSASNMYPTIGHAIRMAKNYIYANSVDYVNARKFTLLGDPALSLAMPNNRIITKSIVLDGTDSNVDTLKALNRYLVTGELRSPDGMLLSNFNGNIFPTLYDKTTETITRANDASSKQTTFRTYKNILYIGKTPVESGKFNFVLTVPKDIDYSYGKGKLFYYAENGTTDASGVDESFDIGGLGTYANSDLTGPDLTAYLDTIAFKSGDVVGENTELFIELSDASGINLSSASLGHEITAVLDENYTEPIVLNQYYQPIANGKGMIRYVFIGMKEGKHSLKVKAWDVYNNSTEKNLEFMVASTKSNLITGFISFPNPFKDKIQLQAELNIPSLEFNSCALEIFDVLGRPVKRLDQTLNQIGSFSVQFEWDGKNTQGVFVQKGLYIARLTLRSKDGKNTSKLLKLINL